MSFDEQCMDEAEDNMDFIFHALDNAICPDDLDLGEGTEDPPCHELECGHSGQCHEPERCAEPLEEHEVGCCADTAVTGFRQNDGCPVWGERDTNNMECNHGATYAEATVFCEAMGGRLCTEAEMAADCTAGTGCSHDSDLLWTSTPGGGTGGH